MDKKNSINESLEIIRKALEDEKTDPNIDISSDILILNKKVNSDGTIMYVLGRSTDRIYQYALSTAFDVSTGVYSGINQSYLVTQDQTPQDLIFNNDGSKMYVVGSVNDKIYEYNIIDSSITVSPTTNTDYTVIGTDVNGCLDTIPFQ